MMGAAISTDDSAYHSWGGILLQDIVLPIRKKPFTTNEHIRYLRWSIVGIGIFAFFLSTFFPLKEFILMWFQITASIFLGGAAAAVIGGLYWSRGTTAGAWAGMISGSGLSMLGIITTQAWDHVGFLKALADEPPLNGMELATWTIVISILLYIIVSLFTCKQPHNMDKLLHRGKYKVASDHGAIAKKVPFLERVFGVGREFSLFDKIIYFGQIIWVAFWGITFVAGTIWNMTHEVSEASWRGWWGIHITILMTMIIIVAIWFTFGGGRDLFRLFHDLKNTEVRDDDDGSVHDEA
jgi:SSS family solute:Na+ symporter